MYTARAEPDRRAHLPAGTVLGEDMIVTKRPGPGSHRSTALHPSNPAFGLEDMLALFRERPELAAINREIRQKPAR